MNEASARGDSSAASADVAAGLGGLAWDLGEPGAVLLSEGRGRGPRASRSRRAASAATLEITAGDQTLEATLRRTRPRSRSQISRGGDPGRPHASAPAPPRCAPPEGRRPALLRVTSRAGIANPLEGAAVFRHLAIERRERVLAGRDRAGATGRRGPRRGAGGRLAARGRDASGLRGDADLHPVRRRRDGRRALGLELWPEDADQSSRAAATRVSGSSLGVVESGHSAAGLFGCHADGTEGFGSYLLWRA